MRIISYLISKSTVQYMKYFIHNFTFNKNVTRLSNLHLSVSAKFPPKILGPKVINATVGQTIEVKITAEHNASDFFVFTVNNLPDVIILANTSRYLLIRWTPTSLQKVCAHIFISVNQHNLLCQKILDR